MRMISRFPRGYLLLAVSAVALGCGVLGILLGQLTAQASPLTAARTRWMAHPIAAYRLLVEERNVLGSCQYDVAVQHEQVVTMIVTDTTAWPGCDQAPTVTRLFDRLSAIDGRCGPNGCACDGPMRVAAVYDPALGYPRYATWDPRPAERWRYPASWLPGHACTLMGFVRTEIRVLALRPQP